MYNLYVNKKKRKQHLPDPVNGGIVESKACKDLKNINYSPHAVISYTKYMGGLDLSNKGLSSCLKMVDTYFILH